MAQNTRQSIWTKVWGYKVSILFSVGLIFVGFVLQISVGGIPGRMFSYPHNIIVGICYLFAIIVIYLMAGKGKLVKWLASSQTAIVLMLALGLLVMLMGVTPQRDAFDKSANSLIGKLGLDMLVQTWYFAFIFIMLLTSLGLATIQRTIPFKKKNMGFILNHLGLWLTLFAGVFGSGDVARLTMNVAEGEVEWRAKDRQGVLYEMPVAIDLHDFTMEEYPGNLYLIDTRTGEALPKGKSKHVALEDSLSKGKLGDWDISIVRTITDAAPVNADKFEHYNSIGSCQAAYIVAKNKVNGVSKEGWISSGSFMFPHKSLYLNDTLGLLMSVPEPKKFRSEVTIYTKSGVKLDTSVEVNQSIIVDGWRIYQLGYDDKMGKWSTLSTFEMVKDPWLNVVYTGLLLLLAGALHMFWIANRQKERENHVE